MSVGKSSDRSSRYPVPRTQSRRKSRGVQAAAASVLEILEQRQLLSTVVFQDHYDTDTTANYVQTDQDTTGAQQDSWTVSGGTLNYARTDTNGWNTSVFLLKPQVASTAGLLQFSVSGDLIAGGDTANAGLNFQPGLVISGDTTNGGFVVMEYDNGPLANHLVLLQETGGQLTGDEGGTGNPPVVADLGDVSNNINDTFHIVANVDRTGAHPAFNIAVTDLTDPTFIIPSKTVTDANVPSTFGGTQIGWRTRYDNPANFSVDNLELDNTLPTASQAPAAPSNLTAVQPPATAVVNLSWTNNAQNPINFTVQRSTDGTNFTTLATVPGTGVGQGGSVTYTDTTATTVGQTYTYRVLAFNGFNGGTTSAPSQAASLVIAPPNVNFTDTYSTDTTPNYTQTDENTTGAQQDTWTVANDTLNYAVQATNGWNTSLFLLKPTVASTAGLYKFTTSGDIIQPQNFQPGLVISGDATNGGFVVAEYDAGNLANHLVLLRETGGQLAGDEGGTNNPPVLADLGDITNNANDTFHISATVDRTGAHPVISVTVTDLTDSTFTITPQTVIDAGDPAFYGGTQIGWRARYMDTTAAFSVDNLSLQGIALPQATHGPSAPSNVTATANPDGSVTVKATNTADNALNLILQYSSNGTDFTPVDSIAAPAQGGTVTFTHTPQNASGLTVAYRVVAFNGFNGGTTSAPSNVATVAINSKPVNFTDTYSTDTTPNYTQTDQDTTGAQQDTWTVANGTLNYAVQATNGWNTSLFLLNSNTASTAGLGKFTTSGDIMNGQNFQPGLVLTGDATNGGFVVQEYDNGTLANHLVLLQETGGQLGGDEGGTTTPPVLADLGDISAHLGDTFHIAGTVDRSGLHPVITVQVTDLTMPSFTITPQTVTATTVGANYGGTQIGWRARYMDTTAAFSVDNLSLVSGASAPQFNKADFNHDGKVGFDDLLILAQNYGKAADNQHGDANGDGKVDFSDLLFLAQNYGKTGPAAGKTKGSLLSDVVGLVKTH